MPEQSAPPRRVIALLGVAGLFAAWWFGSHLYSGPDDPSCADRYAKAHTGEESLAVDRKAPARYETLSGATRCAEIRTHARRSPAPTGAEALLAQAIAATGGEDSLKALSTFEWSGSATVHSPGHDVDILGTWRLRPPDTARVESWPATEDSTRARGMVVAGARGWLVQGGKSDPMPAELLAEERHQFYLYSLLRLLPLKDPGVTLTTVLADSTVEAGILVHQEGRLDAELYFGADQRVDRIRTRFAALPGSPSDVEDIRLEGTAEVGGVHWFRQMHITRNGKPYFDLVVIDGHPATTPTGRWIPKR
jgi:hypothetical protein